MTEVSLEVDLLQKADMNVPVGTLYLWDPDNS